jgi:hypothetical protein
MSYTSQIEYALVWITGNELRPQTFVVPPPPHTWPAGHVPQLTVAPQPFGIEPQFAPAEAHVRGRHDPPHRFGVPPPPQICGAVHRAQSRSPPQQSDTLPHAAPRSVHVCIAHAESFSTVESSASGASNNSGASVCVASSPTSIDGTSTGAGGVLHAMANESAAAS